MKIVNPEQIENQVTTKCLEVVQIIMKNLEDRVRAEMAAGKGEEFGMMEISSQVIALLAMAKYLACTVPAELHADIMVRADRLSSHFMEQAKIKQTTLTDFDFFSNDTKNIAKA